MTDRRPLLRAIFDAAVAAAHPDVVLSAHLPPAPKGRVICLAAGKGAAAMAAAAERHYLDALGLDPQRLTGIATTRHGHGVPTRRIRVVEAGHPVPDEAGLQGRRRYAASGAEATADDLLLVLLSGGGSANWIAPAEGVSFAQKQQVNRALLRSGAPIGEMNIVRKHLSRIKGGRLARAGQPRRRDRDARDLRRAARRSVGDRLGTDGAGSDHAGGRPRAGREIQSRGRRRRSARAGRPEQRELQAGRSRFCPRAIRADRAAESLARSGDQDRKGCGLRHHRSRRRSRRRGARRRGRACATGAEGAQRGQAHRDPVRRRTHRDRARQWPRRPQPGIRAGAGGPAQGHAGHLRRSPPIPTAPTAAPAAPPIRPAR